VNDDDEEDPRLGDARRQSVEAIRECVDRTADVMREAIGISVDVGSSRDQILLDMREQFMARGHRRWEEDDVSGIHADYSNYCAVLISLIEALDRVEELEGYVELHSVLLSLLDSGTISIDVQGGDDDDEE